MLGIERAANRRLLDQEGFERPVIDQPVDHPVGDGGLPGKLGLLPSRAIRSGSENAQSCRGRALRRLAGETNSDPGPFRFGLRIGVAQRHAHHHAARLQGVMADAVNEAAELGIHHRPVNASDDLFQIAARTAFLLLPVPDNADRLLPAKRHPHHIARSNPFRRAVGIALVKCNWQKDIDNGHRPDPMRFGATQWQIHRHCEEA